MACILKREGIMPFLLKREGVMAWEIFFLMSVACEI